MNILCAEKNFHIEAECADTFLTRFCGYMLRKNPGTGKGLLLTECRSIHMFFMRFPICAVYLDRDFRVLEKENIRPWRVGKFVKGTCHVLEIASEDGERIGKGDRLTPVFPEDGREQR